MLPLQKEARRVVITASGRLELCLIELAGKIASRNGATEVKPEHVQLAIQSLAEHNAPFFDSVLGLGSAGHAGKLAG
jgi:hypothetical protein